MNERQIEAERTLENALGEDGFDTDPEDEYGELWGESAEYVRQMVRIDQ